MVKHSLDSALEFLNTKNVKILKVKSNTHKASKIESLDIRKFNYVKNNIEKYKLKFQGENLALYNFPEVKQK